MPMEIISQEKLLQKENEINYFFTRLKYKAAGSAQYWQYGIFGF